MRAWAVVLVLIAGPAAAQEQRERAYGACNVEYIKNSSQISYSKKDEFFDSCMLSRGFRRNNLAYLCSGAFCYREPEPVPGLLDRAKTWINENLK